MKPRAEGGVLDARLNVYGTQNLKVVDLSLCPDNLGTVCCLPEAPLQSAKGCIQNTYSSALLCGEKGADLLAEELGNLLFDVNQRRCSP
jgi:alcohol oxidase